MNSENTNSSIVAENNDKSSFQDDKPQCDKIYTRDDYSKVFDSAAYLRDFYTRKDDEMAMHMMLRFLPNVAHRLPQGGRLLDIGSGPTVHVALCFAKIVDEIYLSDYVQQNRDAIENWLGANSSFDWSNVSKYIALVEGRVDQWREIEEEAKLKIKRVLPCDIFSKEVIDFKSNIGQWDIVTTIFCVEYASNNSAEYRTALCNVVNLIKPGGYFVMGGVFEETWYQSGGKRYSCHYLTEAEMLDSVKFAGIDVEDLETFKYFNYLGTFLIVGKRKH